jgi:hypothetical protein
MDGPDKELGAAPGEDLRGGGGAVRRRADLSAGKQGSRSIIHILYVCMRMCCVSEGVCV